MIEAVLAGLFGLLIGSFLNVCIYRLPRDLSVVHPRSHCTSCERTVAWYDNVPVVSYFLLGAKCRWCKAPIPLLYPIVELSTGVLFFWSVHSRGWNPLGVKLCIFSAIMVDLIFTDWAERILPDEFTLGGALAGLALSVFAPPESSVTMLLLSSKLPLWVHSVAEAALGAVVAAGLLYVTGYIYQRVRGREGLGLGDVKMLLTIGAFLGLPGSLLAVFLGSVFGAIGGAAYIWLAKEDMTYELPFGSFLGAAALVVGLFGEPIMAWYWKLGT